MGATLHFIRACPSCARSLIAANSRWLRTSGRSSRRSRARNISRIPRLFLRSFFRTPINRCNGKHRGRINRSAPVGADAPPSLLLWPNGNSQISLTISIAGTNTFEIGNTVIPCVVSPDGSIRLAGFNGSANANVRFQAFKDFLAQSHQNLFEQAYADTVTRSIADNDLLTTALAGIPTLTTQFPDTDLGKQLNMVARLISARNNLSMRRQIFFCSVQGYDTHGDQVSSRKRVCSTELSQAMNAFYAATIEMGLRKQDVTTFTASDFGRTFPTNGSGSDHGWAKPTNW